MPSTRTARNPSLGTQMTAAGYGPGESVLIGGRDTTTTSPVARHVASRPNAISSRLDSRTTATVPAGSVGGRRTRAAAAKRCQLASSRSRWKSSWSQPRGGFGDPGNVAMTFDVSWRCIANDGDAAAGVGATRGAAAGGATAGATVAVGTAAGVVAGGAVALGGGGGGVAGLLPHAARSSRNVQRVQGGMPPGANEVGGCDRRTCGSVPGRGRGHAARRLRCGLRG